MKSLGGILLVTGVLCASAPAVVLWSDNFNTEDDTTNFDGAPLAGRLGGSVAGETYLRSFGFQQHISGDALLLPTGDNGVRFENALNDPTGGADDRYNWASGSAGAAILGAGGFVVNFDWTPPENTLQDWVSFQVGTINADNGNLTNDDYGILFRNNGATERFDSPLNLGAGGTFTASLGGEVRQVEIRYLFSSFADGSLVNAISFVDGMEVANDSFTWDSNLGEMRMELGHNAANTLIDNLTISTIPEPSGLVLLGLGLSGLALRRRR